MQLPLKREIRLRDIAILIVGGLIVGAVVGFVCVAMARSVTDSKFVAAMVGGTALYGCWLLGYQWLARDRGWDSLQTRFSSTRSKVLFAAAAGGIGFIVLPVAVGSLLSWIGIDVVPLPSLDILPRNPGQLIFAIILIAIIGPLAEELLFRGLLLDWLRSKMNVWFAAVILSAVFALLHYNGFSHGAIGWLAFADRFFIGLVASALTIKYHSLRPSFVMHGTINGIACVASVLFGK